MGQKSPAEQGAGEAEGMLRLWGWSGVRASGGDLRISDGI